MSSPNQYSSDADKAQGYPFAIQLGARAGTRLLEALKPYGLMGLFDEHIGMPTKWWAVAWGYGRATVTFNDLGGFPEMPVYSVKEFINKNKKQGGAVCVK